jgi:exonuclease VII small subunit
MDKNKKEQAEKLQKKLDKLLQTRDKKQTAFEKAKQELNAVTKNIDSVKLKLFEILQSGSSALLLRKSRLRRPAFLPVHDDTAFSNWAKRKIGESGNTENAKTANQANANSANPQKPITQNHQPQTGQSQSQPQNPNQRQ